MYVWCTVCVCLFCCGVFVAVSVPFLWIQSSGNCKYVYVLYMCLFRGGIFVAFFCAIFWIQPLVTGVPGSRAFPIAASRISNGPSLHVTLASSPQTFRRICRSQF